MKIRPPQFNPAAGYGAVAVGVGVFFFGCPIFMVAPTLSSRP